MIATCLPASTFVSLRPGGCRMEIVGCAVRIRDIIFVLNLLKMPGPVSLLCSSCCSWRTINLLFLHSYWFALLKLNLAQSTRHGMRREVWLDVCLQGVAPLWISDTPQAHENLHAFRHNTTNFVFVWFTRFSHWGSLVGQTKWFFLTGKTVRLVVVSSDRLMNSTPCPSSARLFHWVSLWINSHSGSHEFHPVYVILGGYITNAVCHLSSKNGNKLLIYSQCDAWSRHQG